MGLGRGNGEPANVAEVGDAFDVDEGRAGEGVLVMVEHFGGL